MPPIRRTLAGVVAGGGGIRHRSSAERAPPSGGGRRRFESGRGHVGTHDVPWKTEECWSIPAAVAHARRRETRPREEGEGRRGTPGGLPVRGANQGYGIKAAGAKPKLKPAAACPRSSGDRAPPS